MGDAAARHVLRQANAVEAARAMRVLRDRDFVWPLTDASDPALLDGRAAAVALTSPGYADVLHDYREAQRLYVRYREPPPSKTLLKKRSGKAPSRRKRIFRASEGTREETCFLCAKSTEGGTHTLFIVSIIISIIDRGEKEKERGGRRRAPLKRSLERSRRNQASRETSSEARPSPRFLR